MAPEVFSLSLHLSLSRNEPITPEICQIKLIFEVKCSVCGQAVSSVSSRVCKYGVLLFVEVLSRLGSVRFGRGLVWGGSLRAVSARLEAVDDGQPSTSTSSGSGSGSGRHQPRVESGSGERPRRDAQRRRSKSDVS